MSRTRKDSPLERHKRKQRQQEALAEETGSTDISSTKPNRRGESKPLVKPKEDPPMERIEDEPGYGFGI